MRKFVMALALVLMISGVAAAETFTGPITSEFKGGDNFQQIEIDGKWHIVGCGPDSGLSDELRAYLDDHWDKTGSVKGDAVDDPHWGLCIDNAALADVEPEAAQPPAASKLAEYDWIKLPDGLTPDETEVVETTLTSVFWDPVYQVPMRTFADACRYYHDRGFSVDVDLKFVKFEQPKGSTEGYYKVIVTAVNASEDMAIQMPLLVLYNCPPLHAAMAKQNGDNGSKSFVYMNETYQTDRYSQEDWRMVTPADWLVIMKAIIKNGYVQEG
ncbi:hypothetical protein [Pseudodesulfovibrio piezophilus]|uniref:Lipoprotein n=1 Tax=Pseudodesulfovibrio piezophilus (strain DSM 21447 / JCM 15486 / C1TLV30) TaxID=1322246 RepID=M1WVD7_PSEP2|nr:hypothetical protein [Pseudodesulfovibrio piezophilus]CCH48353.1 conserved exported protein of unknown function [Pseudodesulfovibrio piezophilus C1TLV30]